MLQKKLTRFDGTKKMIEECISVFQIGYDNIIFGAGVGGAILYKILKKYNLTEHILGWSDNNRVKHNLSYMEERLKIKDYSS